jgi:prepilin-type N-terminal cleavage/methylation domain-containing protein
MKRGFTLLEVVLALALTVLLLGASMTFLWELADRRSTLARGSRDLHAATVFIERLEADLASGLAGDEGIGGGIVGTETKLKLLTRGVWLAPGTNGSAVPAAGGAGEGDLQATEYEFDPTAGKLSARRYVVKPGAAGGSGGAMELLSDRVERVRFRYYDGQAWQTSFDSIQKGTLPVAIEVAVWFTALKNATAPPMAEVSTLEQPAVDGEQPTGDTASADPEIDTEKKWAAPDRLRVIIVPDGPVSSWKEGA